MVELIKIDLNQTVSKTEAKEKKVNIVRWIMFYGIIISFLGAISWQTVIILRANQIISDQETLKDVIKDKITISEKRGQTGSLKQKKGKIAIGDINNLKEFQIDKRIFWGPKFMALANSIPEDMTISKMELAKKTFKMTLLARFDSLNPKTAYARGMELKAHLESSAFVDNFKDLSLAEYDQIDKKGYVLLKFSFLGEIETPFEKVRAVPKSKKKKADKK